MEETVFNNLKEELLRSLEDVKGSIKELSGEVKAYTGLLQTQGQDVAILKNANNVHTDCITKLQTKTDQQGEKLTILETESKIRQRNTNILISVIGIGLTILNIVIKYL